MKKICAILFLALIFILGAGTAVRIGLYRLPEYFSDGGLPSALASMVLDTEYNLQQQIPRKGNWIDLFGGFMHLTGTDVIQDVTPIYTVYKMKNDGLAFIHTEENTPLSDAQIASIESLRQATDAAGADSWFISIPQKTCTRDAALAFTSRGVTDNVESIDATRRQAFESCGYSVLDLHEKMHEQPGLHAQLYFKTDHHWTAHAGLWAAQQIARALSLPTAPLEITQFSALVYPHGMFGSLGQRCGRLYCTPEDISIPIPREKTLLTFSVDGKITRAGDFRETMIFPKSLEGNVYGRYSYGIFLHREFAHVSICNALRPDGAKILLIEDSFSDVVAPYLALVCGQLDLIDPRDFTGSVIEWIEQNQPDAVVVTMTAKVENAFFDFSGKRGDS